MLKEKATLKDKSLNKAMRLYLKEISKIPLLTVEEERALGYRARLGDKEALQKMIESNLRFVIKIAKKYRKSGLPFLDLINEQRRALEIRKSYIHSMREYLTALAEVEFATASDLTGGSYD